MTQAGLQSIPNIFTSGYMSNNERNDSHNYRPIPKTIFALEWSIAPNNPTIGHLINVLLFAITCMLLFRMLLLYFSENLLFAIITTSLFIFHPIHTEVVANIKSVDEILAMLFFLLSAIFLHQFISNQKVFLLITSIVLLFLSFLSKESAIAFGAVLILVTILFTKANKKQVILLITSVVIATIVYLFLRSKILSNPLIQYNVIENYLFGIKDVMSQKASAIMILGIYIFKLIIPYALICDASLKQFPIVGILDWQFLIACLIIIGLLFFAFTQLKKNKIIAFGIFYFFVTIFLVSNLAVLFGASYGERLLFAPSLGFCLVLAALITEWQKKKSNNVENFWKTNSFSFSILAIVLLFYSVKTFSRNTDWKNDYTLFSHDVESADKSARLHLYLGNTILQEDFLSNIEVGPQRSALVQKGVGEVKKAIEIYPEYAAAHEKMGQIYQLSGKNIDALNEFQTALKFDSSNVDYYINYGKILTMQSDWKSAESIFKKALTVDSNQILALYNLAFILHQNSKNQTAKDSASARKTDYNNLNVAINYLQHAIKVVPNFYLAYSLMSEIYFTRNDSTKGKYYQKIYLEKKSAVENEETNR
jgi:Tfp pilus assembly protein PilF